jgi:PKD repeat protein
MKKQYVILQGNIKNPTRMIILLIMIMFYALPFSFPVVTAFIPSEGMPLPPPYQVDYSVSIAGPGFFYIRPDHNITYQYNITNIGKLNDTYNITLSKTQSWANTSIIPSSLSLSSAESEIFFINVWVPPGTPIGTTDIIDITITSNSNQLMSDSIQTEIVVIDGMLPPVSNIEGPYTENASESMIFYGTNSYDADGYITSYYWDFGDGTNGTGGVVTHNYVNPGNYTVSLNVTDDEGLFNYSQTIVIFNALPSGTEENNNETPGFEIILLMIAIVFIVISRRKK